MTVFKLNPEQIILPTTVRTFPSGDATAVTNYKKWVRKEEILYVLKLLSNKQQ